jgi:DNA-directed RNA polymerase III subunit RPC1
VRLQDVLVHPSSARRYVPPPALLAPQNVSVRVERFKALMEQCKGVQVCPHCGSLNALVKKRKNVLLIPHQIGGKSDTTRMPFTDQFENLVVPEIPSDQIAQNVCEDLNPVRVVHILDNIPTREVPLLMSCFNVASPADMMIRSLIVPPNSIRPSVISADETSTEDDLTIRLREAIDNTLQLRGQLRHVTPRRS